MTWSIFLVRFDLDFGVRLSVWAPTGYRPNYRHFTIEWPVVQYRLYTPGAWATSTPCHYGLGRASGFGLVATVQSAGTIVRQIADEARSILQRLAI